MIDPIPHRWRSIRVIVGDSVKIPIDAENVSVLPSEEDSEEVTISFFVYDFTDSFDTVPVMESQPIRMTTIKKEDTCRAMFRHYQTIIPDSEVNLRLSTTWDEPTRNGGCYTEDSSDNTSH